mmetsp:Transcript_12846/g.23103  ORF Transcript_12846/g.23103 Transcript_12846/m.23103 type:complete len:196 (+) Transcript_12846:94-681(+)
MLSLASVVEEPIGLLGALAEPGRSIALTVGAMSIVFALPRLIPNGPDPTKDQWYSSLKKPSWNPPDYVFPLVWIPLKIMQTTALVLLWKQVENPLLPSLVYTGHILLGAAWNYTFFASRKLKASLPVMASFWLSCLGTELAFGFSGAKTSAYLMIPTNIWACVAAALNISIYVLNKDSTKDETKEPEKAEIPAEK